MTFLPDGGGEARNGPAAPSYKGLVAEEGVTPLSMLDAQ
jgi:hypothetical protein